MLESFTTVLSVLVSFLTFLIVYTCVERNPRWVGRSIAQAAPLGGSYLLIFATLPLGWLVFGLCLCLLVAASKWVLVGRVRPGESFNTHRCGEVPRHSKLLDRITCKFCVCSKMRIVVWIANTLCSREDVHTRERVKPRRELPRQIVLGCSVCIGAESLINLKKNAYMFSAQAPRH